MTNQVWYTVPLVKPAAPCKCWRPTPVRVHRPGRKVYFDRNTRPVFLKPSETAEYTPEELVEYRKSWAVR